MKYNRTSLDNLRKTNFKLTSNENRLALFIAKFIVVLIVIVAYWIKLLFVVLYKSKRAIYKLTLLILAIYLPLTLANNVAVAPRANAVLNGYQTVTHHTTERQEIINYVNEVFGKDADKAFLLLSCENGRLNPLGLHDNEKWGQGIGKDKGLFQINDHWQGVSNDSFLYDFKINTLMAKKIFDNSGHNFSRWACSHKLGLDK